jgi:hypothetical protein
VGLRGFLSREATLKDDREEVLDILPVAGPAGVVVLGCSRATESKDPIISIF